MVRVELTVLLEANWVLSESYAFGKDDIVAAFERVVDNRRIVVREAERARAALSAARAGVDFADALQWAAAADAATLATFDRKFVGRASSALSTHPIVEDIQSLVA